MKDRDGKIEPRDKGFIVVRLQGHLPCPTTLPEHTLLESFLHNFNKLPYGGENLTQLSLTPILRYKAKCRVLIVARTNLTTSITTSSRLLHNFFTRASQLFHNGFTTTSQRLHNYFMTQHYLYMLENALVIITNYMASHM